MKHEIDLLSFMLGQGSFVINHETGTASMPKTENINGHFPKLKKEYPSEMR